MRAVVITGPNNYSLQEIYHPLDNDFIIGADQGALFLTKLNMTFDVALGDFDSVDKDDKKLIDHFANETIEYPIKKDFTDTHLAILEAQKRGYDDILIIGGIGGRFDHSYVNIHLLTLGNISIQTPLEFMYVLQPGEHIIENTHKYISFFAIESVTQLSLVGFSYELSQIELKQGDPLCISNQGSGTVSFDSGLLLVVHQNDS